MGVSCVYGDICEVYKDKLSQILAQSSTEFDVLNNVGKTVYSV